MATTAPVLKDRQCESYIVAILCASILVCFGNHLLRFDCTFGVVGIAAALTFYIVQCVVGSIQLIAIA